MDLKKLFEEFVQAGLYLRGWSPKTPIIYRRAWASFEASCAGVTSLTKPALERWIVSRRCSIPAARPTEIPVTPDPAKGSRARQDSNLRPPA